MGRVNLNASVPQKKKNGCIFPLWMWKVKAFYNNSLQTGKIVPAEEKGFETYPQIALDKSHRLQ